MVIMELIAVLLITHGEGGPTYAWLNDSNYTSVIGKKKYERTERVNLQILKIHPSEPKYLL